MSLGCAFLLFFLAARAQEGEPIPPQRPVPMEEIVVWGAAEARIALERQLQDLSYLYRERRKDRVILRSWRKGMPTVVLHDSGWMELRDGAFAASKPWSKTLSRWLSGCFVNGRKIEGMKAKLVERTWPLLRAWQDALAAETESDPDNTPDPAAVDAPFAEGDLPPPPALAGFLPEELARPAPDLDERIAARGHMVDFRLAFGGLAGIELLEAFREVPREVFLPRESWWDAYVDRPLEDEHARQVAAPSALAWQLKLAAPGPGMRVLELSSEAGYRAALMAQLGARVLRVDAVQAYVTLLRDRMDELDLPVIVEAGPLEEGHAAGAPYDLIVYEGPLEDCDLLLAQLAPEGTLLHIQGADVRRLRAQDGELLERRFLPLGQTVPLNDLPVLLDTPKRVPLYEEHTPGFD